MKRNLLLISAVALLLVLGAGSASAQLHNMGLQISKVWPKGNEASSTGFNSLYGGLFYEYRFTGEDVDKNELRDHFGLEFGINYTEFIKKGNWNLTKYATNYDPSYNSFFTSSSPYIRSSNKGVNFYAAPKFYVTVYPELVELYVMGKVGMQYLSSSGTISGVNGNSWTASSSNNTSFFAGAALGLEIKLGTVFIGANYGFDTNSPQKVLEKQSYVPPIQGTPIKINPFGKMENLWGNTVFEFKIKALLNARD
jgi:hypothetical protein